MTVLLVDDGVLLRAMLCQAFELEDVAVTAHPDPAAALAAVTPASRG